MLTDRGETPVSNMPVKFVRRLPKTKGDGYKLRVDRVTTDRNGRASLAVKQINEVSDSNTVEAEIDLGPFFSARLDSVPPEYEDRIGALEDLLDTKRVTFTYRSDSHARDLRTAVYFIQVDTDGEIIRQPVTAPVLADELSKRRFSVFDLPPLADFSVLKSEDAMLDILLGRIGEDTRRLLVGQVRILEYDRISGFDTARAESIVRLYDTTAGRYLGTWRTLKSGTGSTKGVARRNVLREIGRTLGEILASSMP